MRLASLPAVTDFGALLPRLTAIGGDLTLDDLPGLAGVFDLSKYAFSEHSAVTLRFVSTPKLTELREVYKKSPEALKNLKDPNVRMDIKNRLTIEKALDFLVKENS